MSAATAAAAWRELAAMALARLIHEHGDALPLVDLPWLARRLSMVRDGKDLGQDEIARISLLRAMLARQYRGIGGRRVRQGGDDAA